VTAVTVWNEFVHEQEDEAVAEIYPDGIHGALADVFEAAGHDVRTATLQEPEHGLTEPVLDETDVLTWWGHTAHHEVEDAVAERVQQAVLDGMGLVVLHSGHHSKPFTRLMGTSGDLRWRDVGERERLWTIETGHPIAAGLDECFELPETEMYGERFDVPPPDDHVFTSWFEGGEVFRSGLCWRRGNGSIFYFRPGHESYPIYHDETVQQVLRNAVEWATPTVDASRAELTNAEPREER